jgi:hypothetical protein
LEDLGFGLSYQSLTRNVRTRNLHYYGPEAVVQASSNPQLHQPIPPSSTYPLTLTPRTGKTTGTRQPIHLPGHQVGCLSICQEGIAAVSEGIRTVRLSSASMTRQR